MSDEKSTPEREPLQSDSVPLKHKREHFYIQPLCGIFLPLAFAAYYLWTYSFWLQPSSNPSADIDKPLPNGQYVWWSWFIIGAIGLNISDYTLGGVEAAMMMERGFKPKKEELKIHRDLRWSSLRAWVTVGRRKVFCQGDKVPLSNLWIVLFSLSVLSWSFVLSGLTMQTQDGWKAGKVPGVNLTGVNQHTMGYRINTDILNATFLLWGLGSTPAIPSGATIYVPPNSSIMANVSRPNTLPSNAKEIFLTAQAPVPITGRIWGVVLNYNCSVVHRLDEFTILNRRINSSNPAYVQPSTYHNVSDIGYFYTLDDDSSISVLSQLFQIAINIIGFAEVGMSTGVLGLLNHSEPLGYTSAKSGLDHEEVFEFALWQAFWNDPGEFQDYNFTDVQDPIPELKDEHYEPYNPFGSDSNGPYPWNGNMSAIGVRCVSSSVTGTATVNGLAGTYTDFEREDPGYSVTPTLSLGVPLMFLQLDPTDEENFVNFGNWHGFPSLGNYSVDYTVLNHYYNWIHPLFAAANVKINLSNTDAGAPISESLLQAPQLRDAFIAAYQQYAIQLMFYGSAAVPLENENVTSAVPWTILQAGGGGVPPLLIVITMAIWAVSCAVLSLVYGFRKRWAETFDDYYLYCFCTDSENAHMKLKVEEILKKKISSSSSSVYCQDATIF